MPRFRTLGDIVGTALDDATHQIKMASAAAAPRSGGGDFELDLFGKVAEDESEEKAKKDEKKEKKDDGEKRAAASYATKLAEALELAAPIVQKLAADGARSPIDAPGPAVVASAQMGAAQFPKSPKAATDPGKEGVGPQGALATNAKDLKSTDWTKNKEASDAFVASKIAQASLLRQLGQHEAAEAILKVAQDPSSPQPSLPANSGGGIRPAIMPNVPSGPVPDSAQGVAAMTKAQAKDPTTRTVSEFIQETPKKDPMVAATQITDAGLKVSHILQKVAAKRPKGDDPRDSRAAEIGGGLLGLLGGGIGGGIEGSRHGHTGEGALRGAVGALGGGVAGAALGNALGGGNALIPIATGMGGQMLGAHYAMKGARERWAREAGHGKKTAARHDDAPGFLESQADQARAIRESKGIQGTAGGLSGVLLGAPAGLLAGHALGKSDKARAIGALLGATAGGAGGAALGVGTAKAERRMRERLQGLHGDEPAGYLEALANNARAVREHRGLQGALTGTAGAILGSSLGHRIGKGSPTGTLLGAAGGAVGGAALGVHAADAERKMRERLAREAAKHRSKGK